jgi:uncharacterized membrane protein YeaQ/YmgE (transglycosylase-associated protein family)
MQAVAPNSVAPSGTVVLDGPSVTMTNEDARVDVPERRQAMEFAISLGLGGWIVLIVGALVFGAVAQFIGETRTGYEWLVDAIAAGIGALVASEFIVSWRSFEPTWDGLALVPALLGAIVVGVVVEVATRYMTGGTYSGRPMSA